MILITYAGAGTRGDQLALECRTEYCGDGCQPKLQHSLDLKQGSECIVINDYAHAVGVNWECSGRGICNAGGYCECFEGCESFRFHDTIIEH